MNHIWNRVINVNLHFIVNPVAKNGFCLKIWQMINTYLDEQQITYEVYFTEQSGDGRKLAIQILEATNEPLTIIAVGGDGTIHEVMNGACAYRHGLIGFIPAGSGNDFSRGFSVPKEPLNALKTMLRLLEQYKRDELIRYIDSGKYIIGENRGIFVNNMGCGFDASVALKANKSAIKKVLNRLSLGKLVYFFVFKGNISISAGRVGH